MNTFATGSGTNNSDGLNVEDSTPASVPVGRRNVTEPGQPTIRRELDITPGTNSPATIDSREYSGHSLDRMQERGLTPRLVENTIRNGEVSLDPYPGRLRHYDAENNVTVITNSETGRVISLFFGRR
jgi:hypothetical protein